MKRLLQQLLAVGVVAAAMPTTDGLGQRPSAKPVPGGGLRKSPGAPRVRIGSAAAGPAGLVQVTAGTVLRDRYVVIANSGTRELLFFDFGGRLIRRVGRDGDGPGEFRNLAWVGHWEGDSLIAYDAITRRFSVLSGEGVFGRSFRAHGTPRAVIPLGVADTARLFVALEDGVDPHVTAGVVRDSATVVVVGSTGNIIRTVGRVASSEWLAWGSRAVRLELGRSSFFAVVDGQVLYVDSHSGELAPLGWVGAPARARAVPAARRPLSQTEIGSVLSGYDADPEVQQHLADYYAGRGIAAPVLQGLVVDSSGRLWVGLTPANGAPFKTWQIVGANGSLVDSVELPATARILAVTRLLLLTHLVDSEGVESIEFIGLRK